MHINLPPELLLAIGILLLLTVSGEIFDDVGTAELARALPFTGLSFASAFHTIELSLSNADAREHFSMLSAQL